MIKRSKTSRKSTSATATPNTANGSPAPAASSPPDFILRGTSADRIAAIAKARGVTVDSLVSGVVERFLEKNDPGTIPAPVRLSAQVDVTMTPEQVAGLRALGDDPSVVLERHVKRAREGVQHYAELFAELPPTPTLDRLQEPDCLSYDYQLSRPGLFLPLPGIAGDVEIPTGTALRLLAATLSDFESDLQKLCAEKFTEIKKRTADALLLAELIMVRTDRSYLGAGSDTWSQAQLFAAWAVTGEGFVTFERALSEKNAYDSAKDARLDATKSAEKSAA